MNKPLSHCRKKIAISRPMGMIALSGALVMFCVGAKPLRALEQAEPASIGLSSARLESITEYLRNQVQAGRISGAVAMILRHGRIGYQEAVGFHDAESGRPMGPETIFRIASMTKPITGAAVMMLVEEGNLHLDDPVSQYLPAFQNPQVLEQNSSGSMNTVPADREITIQDLLTHTSGIIYGWFGPPELNRLYREANVTGDLFRPQKETVAARMERLADLPLASQPGSTWNYGLSYDLLGRVIEVVSGLTLDQFFYERFFRPLKMADTHFFVPESKRNRLASLYTTDDNLAIQPVGESPVTAGFLTFSADYGYAGSKRFFSGGGGLHSTATDFARFLQMLLNGGTLESARVLHEFTVKEMTRNRIGGLTIPFAGHGDGFGYGFGVLTPRGKSDDLASVGSFSWGGIFNTYFWADPQEEMIGLLMTQIFPYDHLELRSEFKRLAYEAIDDSGFRRRYWYEKGADHANPYFNNRQLRVNAPSTSVHPSFASRSEARSSGMARILIEENLREVRRADLYCEVWGGHPGTANKRVSVNGRNLYPFPEVGTAREHCTHQYPRFNLPITDLVNGYNALQFACDQGETFWGHYIVDNVCLEIGLAREHTDLQKAGLGRFEVQVRAVAEPEDERIRLSLDGSPGDLRALDQVHYQARYYGYDENGNTHRSDWHGMTKNRQPYGRVGSSQQPPFDVDWDIRMIPAQERVAVRALLTFKELPDLVYQTPVVHGLSVPERERSRVELYEAQDLPRPFWSRAERKKRCTINVQVDPDTIESAELHGVAWTGGPGNVEEYFKLNGHPLPVAEGSGHEVVYSRLPIDPTILKQGENRIELLSDTDHHGIEIMRPGPALMIRSRTEH